MPSVRKSIIAAYPSEHIYSLVTDVASYPNFIKDCKSGRVEKLHEDGYTATLEFSLKGIRKSFTTRNVATPFSEISMTLVSGPFKKMNGSWKFTNLGEHACRVEFELDFEFSSSLIATASAPLFHHISKTMVNSFHQEAVRQFGNQPKNLH